MNSKQKRIIRATCVAVPIAAMAVWTKAFYAFVPLAVIVWVYLRNREWAAMMRYIRRLPHRARRIGSWLFATIVGMAIVAYILIYFVDMQRYAMPGNGIQLVLVNKTKYGAACNADRPERYYRTCRIGDIERNDLAVVEVDDSLGRGSIVSRIVAIAGDTMSIVNGAVIVNGSPNYGNGSAWSTYRLNSDIGYSERRAMSLAMGRRLADDATEAKLPVRPCTEEWQWFTRAPMLRNIPDRRCFPYNEGTHWNAYNMGPIILPKSNLRIELTPWNIILYANLIEQCECPTFRVDTDGQAYVGNNAITHYTFRLDYYWVMADDRDTLNDSRLYGPIPANRIVGAAEIIM